MGVLRVAPDGHALPDIFGVFEEDGIIIHLHQYITLPKGSYMIAPAIKARRQLHKMLINLSLQILAAVVVDHSENLTKLITLSRPAHLLHRHRPILLVHQLLLLHHKGRLLGEGAILWLCGGGSAQDVDVDVVVASCFIFLD